MVVQFCHVSAIRWTADQDKAPVTISAIDIACLVDLQENARMPQGGATGNLTRAITGDAGMGCTDGFGRRLHGWCDSKGAGEGQWFVVALVTDSDPSVCSAERTMQCWQE